MFEYHCWATVPPRADESEEDGGLLEAPRARVAELPASTRQTFHIGSVNEVTVTAWGVRNHWRVDVLDVFYGLAAQSRRAYGLLYVRDDDVEPDGSYGFRVQRIRNGAIDEFPDPFLVD